MKKIMAFTASFNTIYW